MSGTEGESPTDFNECVSKNELQRLVDDQRTYIDGKFDELMRTINSLVTRVEYVEIGRASCRERVSKQV